MLGFRFIWSVLTKWDKMTLIGFSYSIGQKAKVHRNVCGTIINDIILCQGNSIGIGLVATFKMLWQ